MPNVNRRLPTAPLVSEQHFVLATRDTGYRTAAAALAELIDNSLQAGATAVRLVVTDSEEAGVSLAVFDDGCGMDASILRTALQFGGTTRFNDRSGPGRYGMGLPNSSVSRARRVEVYSWRASRKVLRTFLDVDDVAGGRIRGVAAPQPAELPDWARAIAGPTGTLVIWSRCDRLEGRRISTIIRHLHRPLGRMFRYFLWRGIALTINGDAVRPIDPLFVRNNTPLAGGVAYGKPLVYRVRRPGDSARTAKVVVRFVELPVSAWWDLPVEDKRHHGIVKGAGVSVIRAQREVAYGWYFMGRKRKENYDDWWRCEIAFDPELDEYFGLTHSKQAILPTPEIEAILTPDIEAIAHKLNARVRTAFTATRNGTGRSATKRASVRDLRLPQLHQDAGAEGVRLEKSGLPERQGGIRYRLTTEVLPDRSFYSCRISGSEIIVTLNREHPFFEKVYQPLLESGSRLLARRIESVVLALGRSEVDAPSHVQQYWYRRKRLKWSDALATFLDGA
jgi:hypothetical protein